MGYTTVRIREETRDTLRELAEQAGRPMQAVLEEAVETLRRRVFLEQVNAAYSALKSDPKQWAEVDAERRAWESTLGDGLAVREPRSRYPARTTIGRRGKK